MVAPFTSYGIKGVIWYQCETNSNVARAPFYADLFRGLISDWRHAWAQGDFPFLFAQISSFDSLKEDRGLVRDAQRRALELTNTAMAVTTDVGDPLRQAGIPRASPRREGFPPPKDFRRVATCYDKPGANFLSAVAIATAVAFCAVNESEP
jgi:hypothetical protein